jgi:hypothetical protein
VYARDWERFDCIVAQSEDKIHRKILLLHTIVIGSEQNSEGKTDTYWEDS